MEPILARLRGLSPRRRLLAGAALACVLAAVFWLSSAARDERVPLFAEPLAPDQITEVAARLALWNVVFLADPDNVRIDANRRNDVLLRLAMQGVPHRHLTTSAEALAKASPLAPPSVLEAQQREGLAGDLAASLRGIAGVDDAHVIIAAGKDAAFADETGRGASASVRLTLAGGRLPPATIAGIRGFVASAVPGLDPQRVAILDDRGSPVDDEAATSAGEATALQSSLQSALDAAFGNGATIVRVRVVFDPRTRDVREVRRTPLGGRAIGTTSTDERYASSSKHYVKTHASEDRGSDVRDEHTEIPSGRLERLSVAVAVDDHRHLDLAKIHELADATLGLMPQHGDALRVEAVPFATTDGAAVAPSPLVLGAGLFASIVPALVFGFVAVLVATRAVPPLVTIVERLVHRSTVGRATRAIAGFAPAHVRGALRDEPPHTAAAIISALPAATASAVLEMYSPEERAAIVRRMQRTTAPAVPDYETVLRRA